MDRMSVYVVLSDTYSDRKLTSTGVDGIFSTYSLAEEYCKEKKAVLEKIGNTHCWVHRYENIETTYNIFEFRVRTA